MSEYRADTDVMRTGAAAIASAAGKAAETASRISSLNSQIGGKYQGQLREIVGPMLAEATAEGSRLQSTSVVVGDGLKSIATKIDTVMQSNAGMAASAFALVSLSSSPLQKFFAGLQLLRLGIASTILTWTGLGPKAIPVTTVPPRATQAAAAGPSEEANTAAQPTIPAYQSQYGEWQGDSMGPNGDIRRYGCTITSLTMLARYYGIDISPGDFNKWLQQKEHYGYVAGSSNLYWGKAEDYLNSLLRDKFGHDAKFTPLTLDADSINAELRDGRPVILHVPGPDKDNGHYVLAIPPPGTNGTFTILDPASQTNTTVSIADVEGAKSFR